MSVCDIPVISNVCDAVGEGTASLIAAPFDWLASSMAGAASWLMETMWAVFDSTTLVDLTHDGFVSVYNLVFGIALFVIAIFFCLQLITGLVRRDPGALSRAALGAGKSILGSFVVLTLATLLLETVDQLSIGIVQAAGETTESLGEKLLLLSNALSALNITTPGVGAIVSIFLAGLMIAAVGIVWFTLLIRKALILLCVVLAPLALSGASWDATRGWIGKWAMFLVALIVSKLVLVVVFLVAVTQVATPITTDLTAVTEPIAGIVLMGVAAFSPYLVYRLLSFVGFDLYNSIGSEQDAKNALNRPVPMPTKSQGDSAKKVLDGDSGSGGKGSGKAAAGKASSAGGSAGSGSGGGAAGGAGGAAAVGGPALAAVFGAQVVKGAATAGPKAGKQVGEQAETTTDHASNDPSGGGSKPSGGGGNNPGGGTPPPPQPPLPKNPTGGKE